MGWIFLFRDHSVRDRRAANAIILYEKDGHKASDATVILMTMALVYKLVLVMAGIGILAAWYQPLKKAL